ncbi:hypothetical protein [Streptomyces olivoreticuli]|uniref:hypothetical protein n=1 Tax=Streptomyces olivoreticuli TaxID=68246 RepID=UPI0019689BCD|nr:hypothetical protein [Streptomyces olivoreticuli]
MELSFAQVSGSALAAVVAALLAGQLGVYGTVIGAGVVSVVATSGGTIFQHVFKRTGEQIREATGLATKPKPRHAGRSDAATTVPHRMDATQVLPAEDATRLLPGASPASGIGRDSGAYSTTRADEQFDRRSDEFTERTTHGTRLRGWKRPLLAAGVIFVVAMGAVTMVEWAKGSDASGGKGSTSVSRIFGGTPDKKDPMPQRTPAPGHSQDGGRESGSGKENPKNDDPTPNPSASQHDGGTGTESPSPSTSPSPGDDSTPYAESDPGVPGHTPDSGRADDSTGTGGVDTSDGHTTDPKPPQGQNAADVTGAGSQGVAP